MIKTTSSIGKIDTQFISDNKIIAGSEWLALCDKLSHQITHCKECNWLLCEDDPFMFSVVFFALLLAKKNIVLAQGSQKKQLDIASESANIAIGSSAKYSRLRKFEPDANASAEISRREISENSQIAFFTSGSTGEPKKVIKYWFQLANELETLDKMWGQNLENTWIISSVPHKHIYGLLFKVLWPIFANRNVVLDTLIFPEQVDDFCKKLGAVSFVSSPVFLTRACDQLEQATRSIKTLFSSGGSLPATTANYYFEQHQIKVHEVYGSTESGGIAWRNAVDDEYWSLFPDHQAEISQDNTLVLKTPFLKIGEHLKTDDRVELQGRKFLLLGRIDRVLKLHEKRISLEEIENELNNHPHVKQSACFVLNADVKAVLCAVIVLSAEAPQVTSSAAKRDTVNLLKDYLTKSFERSVLPKKWRFVERLPHNELGKLRLVDLQGMFNVTD